MNMKFTKRKLYIIGGAVLIIAIYMLVMCSPAKAGDCPPAKAAMKLQEPKAASKYRGIFGGDLGWNEEHNGMFGLHGGFMAPTDKNGGNIIFKLGPTYQKNDDVSGSCKQLYKTCVVVVPGAGPWGAIASVSYVFK